MGQPFTSLRATPIPIDTSANRWRAICHRVHCEDACVVVITSVHAGIVLSGVAKVKKMTGRLREMKSLVLAQPVCSLRHRRRQELKLSDQRSPVHVEL